MDIRYQTFKGNIAESVDLLGTGTVKAILVFQVGLAIILSLHISVLLTNPWILFLVVIGAFLGLGYSIRPFHFKVKGVWHAIALASSAFFIPFMFLYLVIAQTIELLDVLLILGLTIAHYSMEMGNQAADHLEDSREGLLTPTVRLGLDKALKSSIIMTTAGMVFIMVVVGVMFMTSGFSDTIGLGEGISALPVMIPILLLMSVVIGLGYYVPIKGLKDLYGYSIDFLPIEERVAKIKERIEYAKWQAYGVLGVSITLCILFTASLQAPIMDQNEYVVDVQEPGTMLDLNQLRVANVKVTTHNEGTQKNYADVTVRLNMENLESSSEITRVKAYVDAGTANQIFETSYDLFNTDGRTTVRVNLQGYNESEVWYFVYLMYNDKQSSYTWTEPSASKLYIFDAKVQKIDEGLFQNKMQIAISTFNTEKVRSPGSISVMVEWAPLIYDWRENNATVNPQQVWETTIKRDLVKEVMSESSTLKISLFYDDVLLDVMEIEF